ncbi:MAG TPA: hypothetical protein VME70_07845 [Mycobacteriales bacterium]|nr:hypothetical protein [Mycobacteriales bacterium]
MRQRRLGTTAAAAVTAALTVCDLMPPAVAASNATRSLTPTGASTQSDDVRALTGSPALLVFDRQHRLARDVNLGAATDPDGSGDHVLYTRTGTGTTKKLATVPTTVEYFVSGWSLTGSTLAAGENNADDGYPVYTDAVVWTVPSGKRTTIHLAATDQYLAAAPGGIVYSTEHGTVRERTTSGSTVTLATAPLGVTPRPLVFGGAGPDGVVVGDTTGQAAYIPFAAPHTPVVLDTGSTDPVRCADVTSTYAACTGEPAEDDGYGASGAYLVPLDGSAPTVAPERSGQPADAAAVAGSSLIAGYLDQADADHAIYSQDVYTQPAGSTTQTKAASGLWSDLVSATGVAVAGTVDHTSLRAISSAGSAQTVVPKRASPVSVDTFALASSRVVYADDQKVGSRPGRVESAFARTLSTNKGQAHAGSATLLSTGTGKVTGNLVGASDAITVYATYGGKPVTVTLHVHSKSGDTATVPNVLGQGILQVSGSEVLFQRTVSGGSHEDVYDANTGRTYLVRKISGGIDYTGIALCKNHIAYATRHGAIYRENFRTHQKAQLAKALPHDVGGVQFSVYMHGSWVGWSALPVSHELSKPENKLRNAHTMKPAISLSHRLYSLTSAGALLDTTATFRDGFSQQGLIVSATSFWLRSYDGHTRKLFDQRTYQAGPEIAGGRIAWAADDGVLKVKRLPG